MELWRICKKKYAKTAFSGAGSDLVGGRCNPRGTRCVYTSENAALAAMELFVHVSAPLLPKMVLIHAELEIADLEYLTLDDLPKNWNSNPAPTSLQALGRAWLEQGASVALEVPSVVAPGTNYLLNPAHPDIKKLKVISTTAFVFDIRMFGK